MPAALAFSLGFGLAVAIGAWAWASERRNLDHTRRHFRAYLADERSYNLLKAYGASDETAIRWAEGEGPHSEG